jgi:tRNA threonylcarbamoyladenosine biosynthesis protein TsaB
MKLLALDTASELCSAALWLDGQQLTRATHAPRAHAALILPMIDDLLAAAGLDLAALDAIAFGRGPGAFTGVRLAAAIAQGLGFAARRPLIGISDLRAAAAQAFTQCAGASGALICQDARMEEVYWGCFERHPLPAGAFAVRALGPESVAPPAAVQLPPDWRAPTQAQAQAQGQRPDFVAAGSGLAAYPELSRRLQPRVIALLPDLQPRAQEIAWLAAQDGMAAAVAAEDALPVYLRDRVTADRTAAPDPPTTDSRPDSGSAAVDS